MEHSHHIKTNEEIPGVLKTEDNKKDIGGFFSSIRPWILFVAVVSIYMLIITIGAFIGHQKLVHGIKEPESAVEMTVASVLGLLAFIMGFTFSLTWTRFANRNRMVIHHATAIGVCYLRAGLMPEKQKTQSRLLLREYTEILLDIQITDDLNKTLARIEELHLLIWQQVVSLVKEDVDSELRSLFTASVNDLISLSMERKTIILFIKIPNTLWRGLLLLAAIGMLGFGYMAGSFGISRLFQLVLLPVAFGLVIVLIADLNSQDSQHRFKVTRRPMLEVLDMMKKDIA